MNLVSAETTDFGLEIDIQKYEKNNKMKTNGNVQTDLHPVREAESEWKT